jgi:Fe-S-cluster-containing dehydrogenase component
VSEPLPWVEALGKTRPVEPGLAVDLSRCIGCHACSVACKTAHELPLGTFRMRVRYLMRPERPQLAFLPLFDAEECDLGASARAFGLAPECVRACPTAALVYGDRAEASSSLVKLEARGSQPFAKSHPQVSYLGLEPWMNAKVNRGVQLSPEDDDIIYEQA